MDIVERLTAFRNYTGLTNSQFADRAGIPRPTLSQFLSGRNKRLSDDFTAKLHSAYPALNVLWLLFGEGDMVTDANIEISEGKIAPKASGIFDEAPVDEDIAAGKNDSAAGVSLETNEKKGGGFDRVKASPLISAASTRPIPPTAIPTDPAKKIQSIMVFYSDNSYEIFTPSGEK